MQKVLKRQFCEQTKELKKTKLYDFHCNNGGKMVDFAGFSMPVQYKNLSIMESTIFTRKSSSLFDVSHMGQIKFYGKDRIKFLEHILVGNIGILKSNQVKYSLMLNNNGGIIDDLVIANRSDDLNCHYMVINAGRITQDLNHINNEMDIFKSKNMDVSYEFLSDKSLIALQGPKSVNILDKILNNKYNFNELKFFYLDDININGIDCQVSRSGYTGEDGFEISVSNDDITNFVEMLLEYDDVKLAGLGARDSLRLEAGLCLYGNDLTETITPVEADLLWTMSKKRREEGTFIGSNIIREQIKNGVKHKRVGIIGEKGLTPRAHMIIKDTDNNEIGEITSGSFSPCIQKPIAMGYINPTYSDIDTSLQVQIRPNKDISVKVCELPFVKKGYFKD